jgi:hypothetical protein
MAISRCPYCHAIIDEADKYCINCGTQLLFPEDESVEEEIKGEKIIDAETEDKDYETGELGKEAEEDLDEEPETTELLDDAEEEETGEVRTGEFTSDLAAEGGEEDSEGRLEGESSESGEIGEEVDAGPGKNKTEEVILVDDIEAREKGSDAVEAVKGDTAVIRPGPDATAAEEETKAFPVAPAGRKEGEEEAIEYLTPPAAVVEAETGKVVEETGAAKEVKSDTDKGRTGEIENGEAEEAVPAKAPVPMTFDTHELEGIGKTIELSKDRLDKLLEVMAEKEEPAGPSAPTPEAASEAPPHTGPEKKSGTLPPWADRMKGATLFPQREDTTDVGRRFMKEPAAVAEGGRPIDESRGKETRESSIEAEEEIFPRRKPSDSGIGLPERVSQAALPFGPGAAESEEGEEALEEGERGPEARVTAPRPVEPEGVRPRPVAERSREAAFEAEPEAVEGRPTFQVSVFLKAKAFDVLFVGIFWLVALWVAARSMGATLFELLSVTSQSVLFLYGIFILIYFFLFEFFLGETLGDRLFRERE